MKTNGGQKCLLILKEVLISCLGFFKLSLKLTFGI